jgi:integrase
MASVFKQTYKRPIPPGAEIITRKGAKLARWKDKRGRAQTAPLSEEGDRIVLEYKCWYIAYEDHTGKRVVVQGYTDRQATEQKARDLERDAAQRREGLVTVDRDKADMPFGEALDAYLVDLERLGRDETYRYNIRKLLEKLSRECRWPTLASVRAEPLRKWLAARAKDGPAGEDGKPRWRGKAPRTLNEYLATAETFLDWCRGQDPPWLAGNPLERIERADESDKRRVRRSLIPEQLQRFLRLCGDRRYVYLTAALSGLRRKELRLLQWGDVVLDGDFPHIQLRARATKAKRPDVLPINPELLELLRSIRPADATPATPVFASVPAMRTYKRDLAAAGIPYKDEQGRQADFHALRMAFGTYLQRAGVPIRTAMQLMRHSDIRLTAKVYTDPTLLDTAGAVAKLPRLGDGPAEAEEQKADDGKDGQKAAG